MFLQNLGDRAPGHTMVLMLELTLYPRISPARVLFGHPDNQLADLRHDTRTPDSLPRISPFRSDESPVPREDRLRRDDGGDLAQGLPAQRLSFRRQSTALVVGETHAFPARLELLFQDAVLFDQVGDHVRLLTGDPAGERRQEELKLDVFKHPGGVSDAWQLVM